MDISAYIMILVSTVLINNFILSRFLGLCPFIGVSKHSGPAVSMGLAVTFVTTMASAITWLVYRFVLIPFNLEYLRTLSFILVIAAFVQVAEIIIQKKSPALYRALGIYLALITTNCAVFGVAILNIDMFFSGTNAVPGSFLKCVTQGFGAGAGFILAMFIMSGIRERLEFSEIPRCLKDVPITFIIASLMSMAFLGFSGFKI